MTTELATTKQTNNDFAISNGYICTPDVSTIDGKVMLGNALNGAISMSNKIDEPLMVTDIVTTPGVRSRTGEECTNTYLICDDGTVYFSQSDGIARSIKYLKAIFTDQNTGEFINPLSEGVAFMIKEQKMANGNSLKTVVPVKIA